MQHILDPEARSEAINAYNCRLETIRNIDEKIESFNDLVGNQHALIDQYDEHLATKPTETVEAADDLAEALATNPGASGTKEWIAKLRTGQVKAKAALAEWQDRTAVMGIAINKIKEKIEAARVDIAEMEKKRIAH